MDEWEEDKPMKQDRQDLEWEGAAMDRDWETIYTHCP